MHTHFRVFLEKFFEKKNLPFTYLELQSQMTPYSTGKMRKYFFRLRDGLFLLAQKVPSLIWNWEAKKHPIFKKKF